MKRLKAGDIVMCVDNSDGSRAGRHLRVGQVYEVGPCPRSWIVSPGWSYVRVKKGRGYVVERFQFWRASRFEWLGSTR